MSKKIEYISYGSATNGENYSSGVETLAENVIEDCEQDAIIVFPSKNGWASMRSESYRMTTENAEMVLPFPIYKIIKVLIKPIGATIGISSSVAPDVGNTYFDYLDFINNKNESISYFDITKYILTSMAWQSLIQAVDKNYFKGIYKDNTFYWEKESTTIPILSTAYQIGSNILGGIFADNTPTYERLLRSVFYEQGEEYTKNYYAKDYSLKLLASDGAPINTDPRNWQFRIEYIPMTSATKMRARKNAETQLDYFQPYNQRAEVNSATALGKSMYFAAQKTGVRCVCVVKNYKKLSDIPPLGALVRHNGKRYRLIANDYKMTNTIFIQVTHTLSENWTSKSNRVSVDQKYRNWSIPLEMLWRNLYWEEFAKVSFDEPTETPIRTGSDSLNKQLALVVGKAHSHPTDFVGQLTTFFWKFNKDLNGVSKDTGCVLPCTAMAIGNSLVFSATFKDNYSAGLRKDTYEYCKEVPYCWANGELDVATVILACGNRNYYTDNPNDGFTAEDYETAEGGARYIYPEAFHTPYNVTDEDGNVIQQYDLNYPRTPLFEETFYIHKDRGEALKFTYQIHFVPTDERIIIGDEFLKRSTLIAGYPEKIPLQVIVSTTYFREGDKQAPTSGTSKLGDSSVFAKYESKRWEIGVQESSFDTFKNDEQYVAWAIVDNDNNIYLACNDKTKRSVYIWLTDKK